jgi:hypothetical protein
MTRTEKAKNGDKEKQSNAIRREVSPFLNHNINLSQSLSPTQILQFTRYMGITLRFLFSNL